MVVNPSSGNVYGESAPGFVPKNQPVSPGLPQINPSAPIGRPSGGGGGGGSPTQATVITPVNGPEAGVSSVYSGPPGSGGPLLAQGRLPAGATVSSVVEGPSGYVAFYNQPSSTVVGNTPGSLADWNARYGQFRIGGGVSGQGEGARQGGEVQRPIGSFEGSSGNSLLLAGGSSSGFPVGGFGASQVTVPRTVSPQETISLTPTMNDLYGVPSYPTVPKINLAVPSGTAPKNFIYPEVNVNQEALKAFKQGGLVGVGGGLALGATEFLIGGGRGILHTPEFFSPITYEGKFQVPVVQPLVESVVNLPESFRTEPFSTVGGIAGGIIGGKLLGVVASIPKFREVSIPTEAGPNVVKTFSLETPGGRSFIVGSARPSEGFGVEVFKGAPSVDLTRLPVQSGQAEGIRISNPTETKILNVNIKGLVGKSPEFFVSPERAGSFIDVGQSIIRKVGDTRSSFLGQFAGRTEALPESGVGIILDVARENKGYVSGSFSRSAQLAPTYDYGGIKYELSKVPGDIDIHLEGKSPAEIQAVAQSALERLRDAGFDVKLKGEGGVVQNAILVKQPSGEYVKGVEFLGKGTIPEESVPPDTVLGFRKEGPKIEVGGVQATALSEELRGTLQGVARLRKTETGLIDIYPREGRVKDIGSVSVSARTLEQSKVLDLSGLKGDILRFESLYPEGLVRSQVTEVAGEPSRVILADFRKAPSGIASAEDVRNFLYGSPRVSEVQSPGVVSGLPSGGVSLAPSGSSVSSGVSSVPLVSSLPSGGLSFSPLTSVVSSVPSVPSVPSGEYVKGVEFLGFFVAFFPYLILLGFILVGVLWPIFSG